MIVKHELTVVATCPIDGTQDKYHCTVWLEELMRCEILLDYVAQFRTLKLFQEELTQQLADLLHATVKTNGTHVKGAVATEVLAFPATGEVPINPAGIIR